MGICTSKGPQKVVPYDGDDNLATAKYNNDDTNAEVNFGSPSAEFGLKTQRTRSEDTTYEAKKDEAPCGPEEKLCKQKDSRLELVVGPGENYQSKQKRELPELVKTSTFTDMKKSIAFNVGFNGPPTATQMKFPRKLKKLDGATRLTAKLLQHKQEMAEKNRLQGLQKKTETTSKRQRDVLQAREFERSRSAQMQMNAKLLATEKTRQNHIQGIVSKQKIREQKARHVRAKAHRSDEKEDNLVHVDETYISDSSCEDALWEDDDFQQRTSGDQDAQTDMKDETNSIDEFFETGPNAGTQY